jgi:hypothetical protein
MTWKFEENQIFMPLLKGALKNDSSKLVDNSHYHLEDVQQESFSFEGGKRELSLQFSNKF